MQLYIDLFIVLMFAGLVFAILKRRRLRGIQTMFQRYNELGDVSVITAWIEEKQEDTRMADTLDYLLKIHEHALAIQVFTAFDPDRFKSRHTRLFACKAFAARERENEAVALAEQLLSDYPGDDSILEMAIGIYLDFGKTDTARTLLLPRRNRKSRGTIFDRHFARLTAAEGNWTEAIDIMKEVVSADYSLYKNTFAPAARRQIYDQYVASQDLLDEFVAKHEGESKA